MTDGPSDLRQLLRTRGTVVGMAILAALCLFAFGRIVTHEFVMLDDHLLITSNTDIRGLTPHNIRRAFSTYDPELYIPLTIISYQLNYALAQLQPWIYFVTNLVLHIGNVWLVAWLLLMLTGRKTAALIGAAIFAVHPLQVETVAWASARKDLLSSLFFFWSLALYLRWREDGGRKRYYGSLAMFTFSLLSKVTSVTLPVCLLLIDFLEGRKMNRQTFAEKVPYLLLSILFGIIAIFGKRQLEDLVTPATVILMAARGTMQYFFTLFWPLNLSVHYEYHPIPSLKNIDLAASWAAVLAIVAATVWSLKNTRIFFVCIFLAAVTLAPTFTNVMKGGSLFYASDRYFYVPMFAVVLLLAVGLCIAEDRLKESARNALFSVCYAVTVLFAILAMLQTGTWATSETLFKQALKLDPMSMMANGNYAVIERQRGNFDAAERMLLKVMGHRDYYKLSINLAAVRLKQKRYDEAIALLEKAKKQVPKDPESSYGLALVYSDMGRKADAERAYREVLNIEPKHSGARNNLAALLLDQGKKEEAKQEYLRILQDDPTFAPGQYNIGLIYEQQGDVASAVKHYEQALKYGEHTYDVLSHIGPLYALVGKPDASIDTMMAALAIRTDDVAFLQSVLDALHVIAKQQPNHPGAKQLVDELMRRGIIEPK